MPIAPENAAHEVKSLLGESTTKVEAGSAPLRDAGSTMREIMAGVGDQDRERNLRLGERAKLGPWQREQRGDLDGMTQQNAALVEQSTAAAEGLRDQAQALQALVNRFPLSEQPS